LTGPPLIVDEPLIGGCCKLRLRQAITGCCLAALLSAGMTARAHATRCWQPDPREHIARSDMVFFGEVQTLPQKRLAGGRKIAILKVLRNYKGANVPLLRLLYRDDWRSGSARRGWRFLAGDKLLVFANVLPAGGMHVAADARAGLCSMLPYYARKGLHPQYWDLLSRMKRGVR